MAKQDNWLTDVGQSLKEELDGDAKINAQELFGDNQPDASTSSDNEMASIVSQRYMLNDRQYLRLLAQSNPTAFLRVWKNLGGTVPPPPADPNTTPIT